MMRPKKNEYFLGGRLKGLADRVNQLKEDRPEAANALGGLSGMGMVKALRDRMQAKREMENGGIMKYRKGGMVYAENGDQVTDKEKRFVQSAYGSGEDRITAGDIKANPGLNPFREYIPGEMGMRAKKMSAPGYFAIPGYTDESGEGTFIMEVNPDGSRRAIPMSQVMDEFTTGEEGEDMADILQAMDIGTRTDKGFSMPSEEEQIKTLMNRRANYGLGDINFGELQKALGVNIPELQEGDMRRSLERAMERRAAGARN